MALLRNNTGSSRSCRPLAVIGSFVATVGVAAGAHIQSVRQAPLLAREERPASSVALLQEKPGEATQTLPFAPPSFYRTSVGIREELRTLAAASPDAVKLSENVNGTGIDVARLFLGNGAGSGGSTSLIEESGTTPGVQRKRAFFLFGEHARELISPESGLHLAHELVSSNLHHGSQHLQGAWEVIIVANANPSSRDRVLGPNREYCLRTAVSGVDLNRNFPDHWMATGHNGTETWSGPAPLSEREPTLVAEMLREFEPDLFLTVHSGTLSMFLPFGWSETEKPSNYKDMLQILDDVNKKMRVPYGGAMETIHYQATGNSMDFAYDVAKVPYAFAVEIYAGGGPQRSYDSAASENDDASQRDPFTEEYEALRQRYLDRGDIVDNHVSFITMSEKLKQKRAWNGEETSAPERELRLSVLTPSLLNNTIISNTIIINTIIINTIIINTIIINTIILVKAHPYKRHHPSCWLRFQIE
ncbi:unnamed protein product [Amoebophrya sp. A25]|nr:unnamed protein product [Amoebophrya sp. A25]|eukprot:GSA25T00010882001.1